MFALDPYYLCPTLYYVTGKHFQIGRLTRHQRWWTIRLDCFLPHLGNEGDPTPSSPFLHPLYCTIHLQTNGFYAGDQKLWAYFSTQLAKLFLTISNHSLRLHKAATEKKKTTEKSDHSCSDLRRGVRKAQARLRSRNQPALQFCQPTAPNHLLSPGLS